MGGESERERDLDALYVAVRDGATVDRQAAFDVAMNELERWPVLAEARELAEASAGRPGVDERNLLLRRRRRPWRACRRG